MLYVSRRCEKESVTGKYLAEALDDAKEGSACKH